MRRVLTVGYGAVFLFALLGTGYVMVGVRFEEHDLRAALGEEYERYEHRVPRFVPRLRREAEQPVDAGVPVAQDPR